MLQFTEKEISEQVEAIMHQQVMELQSMGNHHLKRHLVYKVTLELGEVVVYKIYYKTDRRIREIATLKKLSGSQVRSPALLKYGNMADGTEWLLMTALEGVTFEQVQSFIDPANQLRIFTAMGEELGKLHRFATFDFYGDWDEEGRPQGVKPDYGIRVQKVLEYYGQEIERQGLQEKELLLNAIDLLKEHADLLMNGKEFRLIHNDFDGRNVLVHQKDGEWVLSGVIDFEGSCPGNSEKDFVNLYHKYFLDDPTAEQAFLAGYLQYCPVDDAFYSRIPVYMLNHGIGICSWANEQAPDYYLEGVALVERFIPKVKNMGKDDS
jgi:Ser/Thr protein kinase RdoA (MazF antagonist)